MSVSRISLLMLGATLAACSENTAPQSAEEKTALIQAATTSRPADPVLAEKYERTCKSCHIDPENAAPLTGDTRAWAPRLKARGYEGLLDSTLNGFGGMPPLGACLDCTIDDFSNLIAFMAGDDP